MSGTPSFSCVALLETGTLPFTVAPRGGGESTAYVLGVPSAVPHVGKVLSKEWARSLLPVRCGVSEFILAPVCQLYQDRPVLVDS